MFRKLIALLITVMLVMSAFAAIAEETWMPEWNMDADVVVVGFGPAGAMAAKSAMEEGASVLVVEKAPELWLYQAIYGRTDLPERGRSFDSGKCTAHF